MGLAAWSSGGPALLPCPEEPGPLDCNLRAQLLPQFTLQAGWAEAWGLWEGGGLWAGSPLWRWSGGGRAQLTGLPPLWGPRNASGCPPGSSEVWSGSLELRELATSFSLHPSRFLEGASFPSPSLAWLLISLCICSLTDLIGLLSLLSFLSFFFFLEMPCSMWTLSSATRVLNNATCSGSSKS